MWVSDQVFLVKILAPAGRVVHSIKCVLLMERLTLYMGIVHLGGAFEVSTTRIQVISIPVVLTSKARCLGIVGA